MLMLALSRRAASRVALASARSVTAQWIVSAHRPEQVAVCSEYVIAALIQCLKHCSVSALLYDTAMYKRPPWDVCGCASGPEGAGAPDLRSSVSYTSTCMH